MPTNMAAMKHHTNWLSLKKSLEEILQGDMEATAVSEDLNDDRRLHGG